MISNLVFKYISNEDQIKGSSDYFNTDKEPEDIWKDLIKVIQELKTDIKIITFNKLVNKFISHKDYNIQYYHDKPNSTFDITIYYYDDAVVTMIAYTQNMVERIRKTYIISPNVEGNCIDDFIARGIEPLLNNITQLKDDIKSRKNERIVSVEYHRTGCYERDFGQISLIKQIAEKIVQNCNTHLERISEFYTNLH